MFRPDPTKFGKPDLTIFWKQDPDSDLILKTRSGFEQVLKPGSNKKLPGYLDKQSNEEMKYENSLSHEPSKFYITEYPKIPVHSIPS